MSVQVLFDETYEYGKSDLIINRIYLKLSDVYNRLKSGLASFLLSLLHFNQFNSNGAPPW